MELILFLILLAPILFVGYTILSKWFIYKRVKNEIFLAIVLTIVYFLFIYLTQKNAGVSPFEDFFEGLNWWNNLLDPLIGVAVLTVTIGIWMFKVRNEWEDDLEHRLTVSYIFEDKEVMRCEHAVLSHEADIRAWAQHIGSQMVDKGTYRLKLEPFFKKTNPRIEKDTNNKRFKHHYFQLFLYELPENLKGLSEKDLKDFDHIEQIQEENVLVWKILNRTSIREKVFGKERS